MVNLSTGKCVERLDLGAPILCLEFEPTGKILFVGDAKVHSFNTKSTNVKSHLLSLWVVSQGFIHILEYSFINGKFQNRGKHIIVNTGKGISSLEYKSWFNNQRGVRTPQLIAACMDGTVKLCG